VEQQMDMMSSIASMASSMSAASFATQYATSIQKKVMDTQEIAAQEMLNMLPDIRGQYIDTYA